MTQKFHKLLLITLCFVAFIFSGYAQYNIPEKPKFIPPVIDNTNTLNDFEFKALTEKLIHYNDSTSTEIVIAIIPSTNGENIGLLAPAWGQKWGIGQAKEDNGIFVLLAKNDRNIWVAPGYGVESKLTAGINGELIRTHVIPNFKANNYYKGLDELTTAFIEILSGTYKGKPKTQSNSNNFEGFFFFIIFLFILILLFTRRNNRRGGGRGNGHFDSRDLFNTIILSSMGRSGGSFGSSSGGSFGGGGFGGFGGGGGFSGGGAGGSW